MGLLDWLCGCDSPHKDESAQYIASECNGIYPEKKPVVICTDQPKPITTVEPTQLSSNRGSNGYFPSQPTKAANGFPTVTHQNGHVENGHTVTNGKVPVNSTQTSASFTKPDPLDASSFSVPDFKLVENDVQGYRQLTTNVRSIMASIQSRLEQVIDSKQLPNEVDEDVRAARGKIIVIVKNNLSTFESLLQNASDEPQQIADLTGFWGLVHKELLDVQKACERVETSRLHGWKYVPRPLTPPPSTPSLSTRTKTPFKAGQQTPNRTPKVNPNLRAFMAQKRKEMQSNEQLAT